MDKEKQIKEMKAFFENILPKNAMADWIPIKIKHDYKGYAERLYNDNFRKINENDVVLTREDMSKYAEDCIAGQETGLDIINALIARAERYKKQAKELEEQRDQQAYITEDLIQEKHRWTEQERKETAREILLYIGNMLDDCDSRFKLKDYQWHKNLCRKYGVEIGEVE